MTFDLAVLASLTSPLQYEFFQKGLAVAALSGALLGFIGVYITLRGMSYIGHGLSHAIFGGFAAASLVSTSFIYLGAGVWGVASALSINWVTRKHRIGADAAIGVITTASFALGVALLTKFGSTGPSFDNALFGSIYGISFDQIAMLTGVTIATVAFVVLRYRSLLFTTFDPEVAAASGVNVARTEAMLMLLLSLSILATLTVIGVTLVAAMLVIPAVVARMVTDSFQRMLVISTLTGAACGLAGMYLSYFAAVPSGTMIVLTGAAVFCVVLAWQGWRSLTRSISIDEPASEQPADHARSRSAP
ncbi:MAG TPA: metal ABC transporter permease [Actinomycetes bacterium]|nr:metal ABC transporter permease [Actinomycetes bacterium]